jgi:type IV secretory pathway component VirB8
MSDLKDEDRIETIVMHKEEMERLYAARRAELARQVRKERLQFMGRSAALTSSIVLNVALVAAVVSMLPLKQLIPIVVYQREDGTVTNTVSWESLPESVRTDTTINTLWAYVEARESWSEANAEHSWTVVSAMSAPDVRKQFQAAYSLDNPDSPASRYKDGTTVSIKFVHWQQTAPDPSRFDFDRVEQHRGLMPAPPVRYDATVTFVSNVPLPESKQWQRWTFNAPLIQVTAYPGAQREGVAR